MRLTCLKRNWPAWNEADLSEMRLACLKWDWPVWNENWRVWDETDLSKMSLTCRKWDWPVWNETDCLNETDLSEMRLPVRIFDLDTESRRGSTSVKLVPAWYNYMYIKGAQVWDFRSLGFSWFLHHKVSTCGRLRGLNKKFVTKYLGVHLGVQSSLRVCSVYF
jgi:hypothetical protein